MKRIAALTLLAVLGLTSGIAYAVDQNVLTWQDNSNNESNFLIERTTVPDVASCTSAAAGFTQIVSVAANTVTFTDSAVSQGVTYCYRVRASNSAGSSGYTNVAGRSVPFTIPAAPSSLQAGQ